MIRLLWAVYTHPHGNSAVNTDEVHLEPMPSSLVGDLCQSPGVDTMLCFWKNSLVEPVVCLQFHASGEWFQNEK